MGQSGTKKYGVCYLTWHTGEGEVTTIISSTRICPEEGNSLLCNLVSSLRSRLGASFCLEMEWFLSLCRILRQDEEMKELKRFKA